MGHTLSRDACYANKTGYIDLPTSKNGFKRPRQAAIGEMPTLLVEFMGQAHLLPLPPV